MFITTGRLRATITPVCENVFHTSVIKYQQDTKKSKTRIVPVLAKFKVHTPKSRVLRNTQNDLDLSGL